MEPPPCIQNAMMTKDKKPFTYTPGGINLSEIKSPRMARRIERNAAYDGVTAPPPQQQRPQIPVESLPPSALAAMQPQMHVQVFPSGPPPPPTSHARGAPPPPPPPPAGCVVPPPPPPMQALPTQKVRLADQQIVERPDMTKIIPENPMRMLKKTSGPIVRNTLLDQLYSGSNARNEPITGPPIQQQFSPKSPPPQQQWSPPIIERHEITKPLPQSPQSPQPPKDTMRNVNIGSIYIPPINQNQPQSPGTPTLKEAPKPWQLKQQKSEDIPEWAKRENDTSPKAIPQEPANQPRWPQRTAQPEVVQKVQSPTLRQQPLQQQPQIIREPQQQPQSYREPQQPQFYREPPQQQKTQPQHQRQIYVQPQLPDPANHPNAVFVTQPLVLQHPGSGYSAPIINRRENVPAPNQGGSRIIPIQVEGTEPQHQTRNFSGPEQMRKMQLNNSDQELMTRFKQDVDAEIYPHGQTTDPRYMGGAIPSKAFKFLQNMTEAHTNVPNEPSRSKPQVRNIPIQIEGNESSFNQGYVPPSQQTPAEEPRKYMGGSIPSRSFKMLQAMTAPDSCANAKDANENEHYDNPYHGAHWAYPPPFYPPYWYYPQPYRSAEHSCSDSELMENCDAKTPSRCSSSSELENINHARVGPFWGYPPPVYGSNRSTPVPFGYPTEEQFYPPYFVPCFYGYPPVYSPVPFVYNGRQATPEIVVTPSTEDASVSSESETDTEVNEERPAAHGGLQTIKSVQDINVYDDSDESEEESNGSEDEGDEAIPHQLSVIFEVSERTDLSRNIRESSVNSDGTTVEEKSEDEEEEEEAKPMKTNWITDSLMEIASRIQSRIDARIELDNSDFHCQGDDIVYPKVDKEEDCPTELKEVEQVDCDDFDTEKPHCHEEFNASIVEEKDLHQNHCQADNEEAFNLNEKQTDCDIMISVGGTGDIEKNGDTSKESSDSEDWWGVIGKEEDDFPVRRPYCYKQDDYGVSNEDSETVNDAADKISEHEDEIKTTVEVKIEEEDVTDTVANSAHSDRSSASMRKASNSSESSSSYSVDSEDHEDKVQEEVFEVPTIKDRIRALHECVAATKQKPSRIEEDAKPTTVKTQVAASLDGARSKPVSAKSSVKSFDEISEEDSGVTDMSEDFPELRKMSKYQRASTHSRLFQLLQEECESDDSEVEDRKHQLTLPLNKVNDKLADELVQSMLLQKKGQIFRNMSMEKLHAAAKKILQEGASTPDTPSEGFNEFLSPLKNDTGNSTPQEFHQGNQDEYLRYYDSWARADLYQDNYDILPSKTFKLLQDSKAGLNLSLAKCPRVKKLFAERPAEPSTTIPDAKS